MKIRYALVTCLAAACLYLAGLSGDVRPAAAENHTYTVTLVSGATMPLTLDVPLGTALADIALPASLADYVVSVSDGTTTVLAKDLKRSSPPPENSPDEPTPGLGSGIDKPEGQAKGTTSGTGNTIAPSSDSLKQEANDQPDDRPDP